MSSSKRRILIVDDNQTIHSDFRKILCQKDRPEFALGEEAAALFGDVAAAPATPDFELDFASQGKEALALASRARADGHPYMMAFVDVRMPPGWDGIETTGKLWELDDRIEVVICTAYSDYSWEEMAAKLGHPDRFVILKKPFDIAEVQQLANALTEKWQLQAKVEERSRKLQESERRYHVLTETMPGIVWSARPDGTVDYANLRLLEYSGLSLEQVKDWDWKCIVHPDDLPASIQRWTESLRTGANYEVEYRVKRADGVYRWHMARATPMRNATGQIVQWIGTCADIDDQKHAEVVLRRTQEDLEKLISQRTSELTFERDVLSAMLDNLPDCIYFKDRESRFVRFSKEFCRIFKVADVECLRGKTDFDFFTEEHARPAYEDEQEIIRTGKPLIGKLEKETYPDGRVSWVITTKMPWRGPDGSIIGTFGVSKNVTALKEAESKLAQEEALFRSLLDGVPDFIYFKDAHCRYTRVNAAHARLLGLGDPAEAVGKTDTDLLPSRHWRQTFVDEQRICATGESVLDAREQIETRDGKTIWLSSTKVPLRDAAGNITGLVGVSRDITERVRQEQERNAVESRYQTLFESSGDAIMTLGGRGYLDCNTAALKMFGCANKNEFISAHPADFSPPTQPDGTDSKTAVNLRIMDAFKRGMNRFEWVHRRRNGDDFPAEVSLTALSIGDQRVLQATVRDLTEFKKAEKERQRMEVQLRQAQKLESIGQLAAGIAHEINTPTQYVGDNTRFLKDSFESISQVLQAYDLLLQAAKSNAVTPDLIAKAEAAIAAGDLGYLFEQVPSAIKETLEGVERVTKIVRAMKEFSHPGSKEKAAADLNKAIETTVTVARNEWKYVADLELELDPSLPPVPCFVGEFNQCILNLVVNAAHAISDVVKQQPGSKGRITVRTRRDGDHVEVRVSDTGTGIPEAARPRIFEPFFTTKDVGKGTGQGLSIVYASIVKKHGGAVTFETETGKGTTFILRLPVTPRTAGGGEPGSAETPPAMTAAAATA